VSTPFAHPADAPTLCPPGGCAHPSYTVPARARVQQPCHPRRPGGAPARMAWPKRFGRALRMNRPNYAYVGNPERRRRDFGRIVGATPLRAAFGGAYAHSLRQRVGSGGALAGTFPTKSPWTSPDGGQNVAQGVAQQNGLLPLHPNAQKSSWPQVAKWPKAPACWDSQAVVLSTSFFFIF
jgi:hypothetical protein